MKISSDDLKLFENIQNKKIDIRKLISTNSAIITAKKILTEFMNFKRVPISSENCGGLDCQICSSLYLPKVLSAVSRGEPVLFVLPAFPGKSPNLEKVIGPLPDFAEQLSLNFLGDLCRKIRKFYPPGIKIILCSDGRVFSDLVGIKEENVTSYQSELNVLIEKMSLQDLLIFNLDVIYKNLNFVQMRFELMKSYGCSLDDLKQKIRRGRIASASSDEKEANCMYCGITRFLFEDSIFHGQTKSRSAIQKESRTKAYEVIRRSNAWSELIADYFPEAVRLSIHPQTCGSKKLGIRLIGNESWMTPWHGVAVETNLGYILLKRSQAETLGAELVYASNGNPSHFKLKMDQDLCDQGVQYELSSYSS